VIDVIIPTFANEYWLTRCLKSIADGPAKDIRSIIIVDNHGGLDENNYRDLYLPIQVIRPGENLGWTRALKFAYPRVTSEFVMFLNDDTEFETKPDRIEILLDHFKDPEVAAVGPGTGVAMGRQALPGPPLEPTKVLIGFCMLVRKSALDEVGGIHDQWNIGDDVDLSIRFSKAGKKLLIDRRVFVYHHAFKTGTRIYGPARSKGGWNSLDMVSGITQKLVMEHGSDAVVDALKDTGR